MNVIQIDSLEFHRPNRNVFSNFTVTVEEGQFVGLLGANGTGKSTLLKLICGILPATSGEISIFRHKIDTLKPIERAKLVSYMPQFSTLQTDFTVQQVVEMGRYPHKKRFSNWKQVDQKVVEYAMELAEITHLRERYLPHLSGGERQLVYLAKAIAQDTPLLLLDEPTSDLDIYHQLIVTNVLKKLQREGKTIIAAIHDINLAARICDKCLLIRDGRIVEYGETDRVLNVEAIKLGYNVNSFIFTEPLSHSKQMIPYEVIKEVKQ